MTSVMPFILLFRIGMHGCIGSADATHIVVEQMLVALKQYNIGGIEIPICNHLLPITL